MAANRVIGRDGQLPWHLPDDLKHFKSLTMGHPIIMGRRTFESIGRALPGRRSIVVSRTLSESPAAGVEIAGSIEDAIERAGLTDATVFVIGGAAMYEAAIPLAAKLHLTELDDPIDGDTFFPAFDRSKWHVAEESRHDRDARHAMAFTFRTYQK